MAEIRYEGFIGALLSKVQTQPLLTGLQLEKTTSLFNQAQIIIEKQGLFENFNYFPSNIILNREPPFKGGFFFYPNINILNSFGI
jgi:hypothetical protein